MSENDEVIRFASTVVVLRDAEPGLEVLLVRRVSTLAFYGGAWVFPGGRIDAEDGDLENALEQAALRAAARELREEAGLTVDESALAYFARWLTPPGRTRRFDTFYYAAIAPEGEVQVDRGEVDDHRWMQPIAALEAHTRGEIELPPPTFVTLTSLVPYARASEAHARLPIERQEYLPRPCKTEAGTIYLYFGDAGYETRDPSAAGPRHRLTALTSPWRYERG
jgi:8-oxo-dGTP pyrophosphatase MutT (NUDIX family)